MSNLSLKATLCLLLVGLGCSLTVGSLSCCPETYIYDRDTLTCVCPKTTPYLNAGGRCVACAAPARWDLPTRTCQHCRADQTEQLDGTCLCPHDTPFNNGTACAPCPDDLPVWNGKKCVACPVNTHFDYNSKTCTVCPEGLVYVKEARECEIAP
jgi:hypothetical protein